MGIIEKLNINTIISKDNKYLKEVEKLNNKKYREKLSKYYIDGRKMLIEAICYKIESIDSILITKEYFEMLFENKNDGNSNNNSNSKKLDKSIVEKIINSRVKINIVNFTVIEKISEQVNPEGVITVMKMEKEITKDESNTLKINTQFLPILENISDPGNLGTILRTLVSCGIDNLVLFGNCIDLYSPKVIRASMGAFFKINVIKIKTIEELNEFIKYNNYYTYYTDMVGTNIYKTEFKKFKNENVKVAIAFGNEANGITKELETSFKNSLTIPILNTTESLNLSMSVGIIFYEIYRQTIDF